jgi:hypothetical protein
VTKKTPIFGRGPKSRIFGKEPTSRINEVVICVYFGPVHPVHKNRRNDYLDHREICTKKIPSRFTTKKSKHSSPPAKRFLWNVRVFGGFRKKVEWAFEPVFANEMHASKSGTQSKSEDTTF